MKKLVAFLALTTSLRCRSFISVVALSSLSSSSSSSKGGQSRQQIDDFSSIDDSLVHTLLLCRHGDSIWNGGEPGSRETFTGWTNVPLSQKGIQEAQATGRQVSEFELGIDACFTSILQRAQLTAHYCLWGFSEKPNIMSPRRYFQDYRLNERHYGALQGFVKEDVEKGMYGHDADLVQQWRRSWYTVPPQLEDNDPRRLEEIKAFANFCGGPEKVPRGESLEQVAEFRIRPFLEQRLCPVLEEAALSRGSTSTSSYASGSNRNSSPLMCGGGTGLVVAHANSLRALIGVICNVQVDAVALKKLEALRLQTGVPLVLRFRQQSCDGSFRFQPCDVEGIPFVKGLPSPGLVPELPVYPLSSIPMKPLGSHLVSRGRIVTQSESVVDDEVATKDTFVVRTVPF